MPIGKTLHFKSEIAYKKYEAFKHIHLKLKPKHGKETVMIAGKKHVIDHDKMLRVAIKRANSAEYHIKLAIREVQRMMKRDKSTKPKAILIIKTLEEKLHEVQRKKKNLTRRL
jgi:uncharacterized sporulation protein YeaH/YhbH (DUF444 family)